MRTVPRDRARSALLELAAEVTGDPQVSLVHACAACGSAEHGRPVVRSGSRGIGASLSRPRAKGPAVVAVCLEAELGIDVEASGDAAFAGFDDVALHPRERCRDDAERTRAWVRKEALLKAHGTGLATDPREVRLSRDGRVLDGPAGSVLDVGLGPDWTCAIAVTPPRAVRAVLSAGR